MVHNMNWIISTEQQWNSVSLDAAGDLGNSHDTQTLFRHKNKPCWGALEQDNEDQSAPWMLTLTFDLTEARDKQTHKTAPSGDN